MNLYDMLTDQEKAYHDALVSIRERYGPMDKGTSSIWVGYESSSENDVADIGVKCGNCAFHYEINNNELGCKLVSFTVEENGKCRLAAIPDGLVNMSMDGEMSMDEDTNMYDDMTQKATSVSVGDMVSWSSSGGTARGKVVRVIRNGKYNVPNSDFTITGTPDNPAVAIRIYRDDKPTDTIVGHKMSTLRRVGKSMNKDIEEAMEILKSLQDTNVEKGYGNKKEKSMHEDKMKEDWEKRDYTSSQRRAMARRGIAMSDGSFPIANRTDLGNAIQSVGRAANYDAARRHIIGRARALGAMDMLPEEWGAKKSLSSIFDNMPNHARRINTTGNAPLNVKIFRDRNEV